MNNSKFEEYGLTLLNEQEAEIIDGGILTFLVIGAALLLAGCSSGSQGGNNNVQVKVQCNNCTVNTTINGDTTTT